MLSFIRTFITWIVVPAGLGSVLAATLLKAPLAHACSCAPFGQWQLSLTSVQATNTGVNHGSLWPDEATLAGNYSFVGSFRQGAVASLQYRRVK